MELLKPNLQFSFDVYFENITDAQLKQLVWVLTLGENPVKDDANKAILCHKIGHGKPLGLGSAKIIAERVEIRKIIIEGDKATYKIEPFALTSDATDGYARKDDEMSKFFKLKFTDLDENDAKLLKKIMGSFAPLIKQEKPIARSSPKGLASLSSLMLQFSGDSQVEPKTQTRYKAAIPYHLLELLRIVNINTCKDDHVCYPLADDCKGKKNSRASHQWFIGNRQRGKQNSKATGIEWSIENTLPKMSEIDYTSTDRRIIFPELTLNKLVFKNENNSKKK
jgi:hypothetical protein